MMRSLMVAAVLLAACAGDGGLELTDAERDRLAFVGWNHTARVDLDVEDWVEIAEQACDDEPWLPEVQAAVVREWDLDREVPTEQAMFGVFIVSIEACRDRFPAEVTGGDG